MTAVVPDVLSDVARRIAAPGAHADRAMARELIATVLDLPNHWAAKDVGDHFSPAELRAIDEACGRLRRGMPLAYAARRAAFRTLDLVVDERVLIPRPETEVLVDIALEMVEGGAGAAIDVGTGSGALALALAVEGKFARIMATDVSLSALAVAAENADRVRLGFGGERPLPAIEFGHGSWLAPCRGERAGLVVSNPPYIAYAEAPELPASVRDWEPPVALYAGEDGLASVVCIAQEASAILTPRGVLVVEVDSRRAGRAASAVASSGAYGDVNVRPDLTGRARFVVARRRED
jgi:release factor glutamine methyltransferase